MIHGVLDLVEDTGVSSCLSQHRYRSLHIEVFIDMYIYMS